MYDLEQLKKDFSSGKKLKYLFFWGNKNIEYLEDYGTFEDVPLEFIVNNLKEHYPSIFDTDEEITEFKI